MEQKIHFSLLFIVCVSAKEASSGESSRRTSGSSTDLTVKPEVEGESADAVSEEVEEEEESDEESQGELQREEKELVIDIPDGSQSVDKDRVESNAEMAARIHQEQHQHALSSARQRYEEKRLQLLQQQPAKYKGHHGLVVWRKHDAPRYAVFLCSREAMYFCTTLAYDRSNSEQYTGRLDGKLRKMVSGVHLHNHHSNTVHTAHTLLPIFFVIIFSLSQSMAAINVGAQDE
jgi:hypothetical protein